MKQATTFQQVTLKRDFSIFPTLLLNEILEKVNVHDGACLDIGCGTGQLSRELFHYGFDVTGIDTHTGALRLAQAASKFCKYIAADLEKPLPPEITSQQFTLITCKHVIAFIQHKEALIAQVKRLLTPQGCFIMVITTPEQVSSEKRPITTELRYAEELLSPYFSSVTHFQTPIFTVIIAKN